jgi:hypothetical protein
VVHVPRSMPMSMLNQPKSVSSSTQNPFQTY